MTTAADPRAPRLRMPGRMAGAMTLGAMTLGAMTLGAMTLVALAVAPGPSARAQDSSSVSVDMSALDAPAAGLPTPAAGLPTPAPVLSPPGRIILTPPPGVAPMSAAGPGSIGGPGAAPIKLKPPKQGTAQPRRTATARPAPTPAPAAPAETPPAAAPAQPAPAPAMTAMPAAPEPAPPPTAVTPPPVAAAPATPTTPVTAAPSPAATRAATTEQAGPALAFGPAESATPTSTEAQTAAVTDAAGGDLSEESTATLSLPFAAGVAEITGTSLADIKALAERMAGDRSLRVQLLAYASDPEKNTSRARRLALDRAVAVRNLLIDAAVERTRIEVRALGDQVDAGPPDRVDAVVVKR